MTVWLSGGRGSLLSSSQLCWGRASSTDQGQRWWLGNCTRQMARFPQGRARKTRHVIFSGLFFRHSLLLQPAIDACYLTVYFYKFSRIRYWLLVLVVGLGRLQLSVWRTCPDNNFWTFGWLRCRVVKRWSLTGELSLSHARPAADGWPLMWVSRPL